MFVLSNMGKEQEFLEAARNGNITVVEKILNQKLKRSGPLASLRRGPGANVQDSSGYSALHHAALNGHTDIVRLLLAHDASPNLPDSRGSSPLHLAAWAGHQDIVKLFLTHSNKPANPNLQTIENETPLHCAAQHGHTGALTTLLAHGADPNVMNSRNETPLDLAAQYGRLQAVQMLIRAHPELLLPFKSENMSNNKKSIVFDHTPLHLASRNGHKSVVDVLLAAGVNVNVLTPSGTALHEAALCGKDTIVRTLLDSGADLDATDCEGRTAIDILEEFPPHVTKGIVSVINNHRNSTIYDSESDETRDNHTHKNHTTPMSLGSSYENNRGSPLQNYFNSHYDLTTSPSSSVGSFGPPSPSQRPRNLTDVPEFYITMTPIKQRKPAAPKKPPRRNLSVSPTHLQPHNNLMPSNIEENYDNLNSSGKNHRNMSAYEYICMARTGKKPEANTDQYVEMSAPEQNFQNIVTISYENTTLKSYNPNRKLKRNRNIYEPFSIDFNKDRYNEISKDNTPRSPTNYQQPPTPEHPPPTAVQAEKCIHERIRPLSQEYKKRSGLQQNFMIETSTSPPELLCSSLCASSGSISSSISISDRSVSTDCVEEFIGDVPFAGLFKGSTINLNNSNYTHTQQQISHYNNDKKDHAINNSNNKQESRSKLLHPTQYSHDIVAKQSRLQNDYLKNRSNSFDGIFDNYDDNNDDNYTDDGNHRDMNIIVSTSPTYSQSDDKDRMNRSPNIRNYKIISERLNNDGVEDIRLMQQQYNIEQRENLRKQLQNDFKAYLKCKNTTKKDNNINLYNHNQSQNQNQNQHQNLKQKQQNQHQYQYQHQKHKNEDESTNYINHSNSSGSSSNNSKNINSKLQIKNDMKSVKLIDDDGNHDNKNTDNNQHNNYDDNNINDDDDDDDDVDDNDEQDISWSKVTEIMDSFNTSDILKSNTNEQITNGKKSLINSDTQNKISKDQKFAKFLEENDLQQFENLLQDNGFDDIEFLNGILDESDLKSINVPQEYHKKFMELIKDLPISESSTILHRDNNNTILNVEQWLQSIHLSEYIDIFKQHLHTNSEGVCRVWEVELQTVLEIGKLGHRKRILHSISSNNRVLPMTHQSLENLNTNADSNKLKDDHLDKMTSDKLKIRPVENKINSTNGVTSGIRHSNKKNRPAPKPPIYGSVIEIREPSELLLGLPSNLQTQWRHSANNLINSSVKYDAYYLGSTVVKELRGTESTRKSIQKLKRGDRLLISNLNISQPTSYINKQQPQHQLQQQQQQQLIPQSQLQMQQTKKQPIRLSISHRGVEFIDIETQKTICEHAIRNINCACQDADDLSHFAYITKDSDINTHYCHVFNVDSMDLATEIILTLGQAFEVAYQLALRDASYLTSKKSVLSGLKLKN